MQTSAVITAPCVSHHCFEAVTATKGMPDLSNRQICEHAVGAMTAQVSRQGAHVSCTRTSNGGETISGASKRRDTVCDDADSDKGQRSWRNSWRNG